DRAGHPGGADRGPYDRPSGGADRRGEGQPRVLRRSDPDGGPRADPVGDGVRPVPGDDDEGEARAARPGRRRGGDPRDGARPWRRRGPRGARGGRIQGGGPGGNRLSLRVVQGVTMGTFVRVATVREIAEGTGRAVEADGRRVALFNVD